MPIGKHCVILLSMLMLVGCTSVQIVSFAGNSIADTLSESDFEKLEPLELVFDESGAPRLPSEKEMGRIEKLLQSRIDRLKSEVDKVTSSNSSLPRAGSLSPIRVRVSQDSDCIPVALAAPPVNEIQIPLCYLQATIEKPYDASRDALFGAIFDRMGVYARMAQAREIIDFVLAHELTHIWLDHPRSDEKTSIDEEIEADAWGVIFSMRKSAAAEARAQMA